MERTVVVTLAPRVATVGRVRLTVLGSCGAWPVAGQPCSGDLVEHDGFRLLLDVGYATVLRLLESVDAAAIDAVVVSHRHPDHCADLNPLLRARVLRDDPAPPLPVFSLPGALDAVLALDRPGLLEPGLAWQAITPREPFQVGPFRAQAWLLPHSVPNAGVRLTADSRTLAYTGDSGPSEDLVRLATDADLLLADASHEEEVPTEMRGLLGSAADAGRQAGQAGVGRLLLAHLLPGTDPIRAVAAAAASYRGRIDLASTGLVVHAD